MTVQPYVNKNERGSLDNLLRLVELATDEDRKALRWYHEANQRIRLAAEELAIDWKLLAGAVAALSPMRPWDRNIRDAVVLAESLGLGLPIEQVPIAKPAGYRPLYVAAAVLAGDLDTLKGPKVCAFYENLIHPHTSTALTIDSHALNAWRNCVASTVHFPISLRRACEGDYRMLAEILMCAPSAAQALVWAIWIRMLKIWRKK